MLSSRLVTSLISTCLIFSLWCSTEPQTGQISPSFNSSLNLWARFSLSISSISIFIFLTSFSKLIYSSFLGSKSLLNNSIAFLFFNNSSFAFLNISNFPLSSEYFSCISNKSFWFPGQFLINFSKVSSFSTNKLSFLSNSSFNNCFSSKYFFTSPLLASILTLYSLTILNKLL